MSFKSPGVPAWVILSPTEPQFHLVGLTHSWPLAVEAFEMKLYPKGFCS